MQIFDSTIKSVLEERLDRLEKHFEADVIFYYGEIFPQVEKYFRDFLERLKSEKESHGRLVIFLSTPGGSVETVEKLVEIARFHYPREVFFVVPDYAMSAGTIFCMSGNRIYMDYSSSLGPIDPQVHNGKDWVPALGYLDKVEELLEKAQNNTLTHAEFLILQSQDLATLSRYEQARNLTITLLKKWLVQYKFRDWTKHKTNGKPVTVEEKQGRAEDIAMKLGSNKLWHSHNRKLSVQTLQKELKLQIEDYSGDMKLRPLIRSYSDLLLEYIAKSQFKVFLHSRYHF